MAILFKRGFNPHISNVVYDLEGRYIILQCGLDGELFTLINIYAPTQSEGTEQASFLERLNATVDELEASEIFIGGDFNIDIPAFNKTLTGNNRPHSHRATYISRIQAFFDQYSVSDASPLTSPLLRPATFHRGTQSSTIVYWFIPDHLLTSSSLTITPNPLSDHSTLSLTVGVPPIKKGPGYWRFNNQLLQDANFVQAMENQILETLNTNEDFDNPMSLWEWIKYRIRQFCIQYSIKSNRGKRAHTKTLEDRLATLPHDHNLTGSPDIILEVASIKRELAEI